VFFDTPASKSEQLLCHGQLVELVELESSQPEQQGLVQAALLVVQLGQMLESPLQMLQLLVIHYRHELLQPVLSG
jgi:hypothetical protein